MTPPIECALCKCLDLIVECKKNLTEETWNLLLQKVEAIKNKELTSTFCEKHRIPIVLIVDYKSITAFIEWGSLTLDLWEEHD